MSTGMYVGVMLGVEVDGYLPMLPFWGDTDYSGLDYLYEENTGISIAEAAGKVVVGYHLALAKDYGGYAEETCEKVSVDEKDREKLRLMFQYLGFPNTEPEIYFILEYV